MQQKTPRALVWFYILVLYVTVQLIWWAINIVVLSNKVYHGTKAEKQFWMIIGEGAVFFGLMLLAVWQLKRSFRREIELNQKQRNFLLSTTHELKTPLSVIKLNLQTMQKRDLDENQRQEIIKNALLENDRLNEMIENMLLASRMQSDSKSVTTSIMNISLETTKICEVLKGRYSNRKLVFNIENNIYADFDSVALDSIISNLVENAVKYSQSDSLVSITLKTKDTFFELSISDNGSGIKDKVAVKKMFYREQNEETRTRRGTGLGLYIVEQFCLQMGFTLNIKDNLPQGTVITIKGKYEEGSTGNS